MANHSDLGFVPDSTAAPPAAAPYADLGFTPDAPKAAPVVPGMEKLGPLPGPAKPPTVQARPSLNPMDWGVKDLQDRTPQELDQPTRRDPRTGRQYTVKDEIARVPVLDDPTSGVQRMAEGVAQAAQPGLRNKAGGASKIIRGGMQAATPLLPGSLATAPLRTAAALGIGTGASKATEGTLKAFGVPDEYSELAGDVMGIAAGGTAVKSPATVAKVAGRFGGKVKNIVTEALGKTTGAGGEAIRTAMENPSPQLKAAMRGEISESDIVGDFRSALQAARSKRGAEYRKQLAEIQQKGPPVNLDLSPIDSILVQKLADYRVQETPEGALDFSGSAIGRKGQGDIQEVVETIRGWTDKSPLGVDALKRRLDDLYSESSQARGFTQGLKAPVKQILDSQVPGYREMTSDYAKASELIDSVQKELSLGKNANTGTAIRKLTYALKQNNEYRKMLTEALSDFAPDKDLKGQLAGYHLNNIAPRGLMGVGAAGEAITALAYGHPGALAALVFTSPRLIGETAAGIGSAAGRVSARLPKMTAGPAASQAKPLPIPFVSRPPSPTTLPAVQPQQERKAAELRGEPPAPFETASFSPGQIVQHRDGKRYRVNSITPDGKIDATEQP